MKFLEKKKNFHYSSIKILLKFSTSITESEHFFLLFDSYKNSLVEHKVHSIVPHVINNFKNHQHRCPSHMSSFSLTSIRKIYTQKMVEIMNIKMKWTVEVVQLVGAYWLVKIFNIATTYCTRNNCFHWKSFFLYFFSFQHFFFFLCFC